MIVGTPSWRSLAPSAMPPWPPPTITTSGCVVWPSSRASRSRCSSHVSRSRLPPCSAPGAPAARGAGRPPPPGGLLMALELVQGREQRPRLAVLEAQVAAAAPDLGLELDPRLGDAVGGRGRLGRAPAAGLRVAERGVEHRLHAVPALDRLEVPRERDEVAPVAVVAEQIGRGGGVALCQCVLEAREPRIDLGGDGRGGGVGHGSSWAGTGGSILPNHTRRDASDRAGSPWLVLVREPDQLGVERTHPQLAFGVRLVELAERDRH